MTIIEDYQDDLETNASDTLKDVTRSLKHGIKVVDDYEEKEKSTRERRDSVAWQDYTRNEALHELIRVRETLRQTLPRIRDLLNAKIAAEQLGNAEQFLEEVKEELNRRAKQNTEGDG